MLWMVHCEINIAFGQAVSDEDILEASHLAELQDVIHEKGLDFVIGEGGIGLSGGELQRIALARAFYMVVKFSY